MRINFVLPPLNRKKYSGGYYGLFQYAHGLTKKGHDVRIIPMLPGPKPEWFDCCFPVINVSRAARTAAFTRSTARLFTQSIGYALHKKSVEQIKAAVYDTVGKGLLLFDHRTFPMELRRSASILYLSGVIPEADVTVATSYETALPVALHGTGKLFYFAQHFEPLFCDDLSYPKLGYLDALSSYRLGLKMIANSTWLKNKLEAEVNGMQVDLCLNAIDNTTFIREVHVQPETMNGEINIISYGGRAAIWKGFPEMVQAMRIARKALPDVKIKWKVYGDSLIPANNDIAEFESLGFLKPHELAKAYHDADILLSASWYESFPAFPLEAMASGLAVITTQCGTEDFAVHGETAEIVEAKNPESIANGLIHLITDADYRKRLAQAGNVACRRFTWENSVNTMEKLLTSQNE